MSRRPWWIEHWQTCGVSVTGPKHESEGLPNQDAWGRFSGQFGAGVVVSDGMGSKPHSDFGSKAACVAVAQAVRIWSKERAATDEHLLRLIHNLWNMKVQMFGTRACAATCLFALVLPSNQILLAQLGDGLALIHTKKRGIETITPDREGFANETTALGVASRVEEWQIQRFQASSSTMLMLATDGIADDIEDLPEFIHYLKKQFRSSSPQARVAHLRTFFQNWPRPYHSDDKTLAVMWTRGRR